MNFFKLSLIATSLILVGCGSDSKSSDNTNAKDIKEATKNLKAIGAISSLKSINNMNSSKTYKISTQPLPCSGGGTMSIDVSDDNTETNIVMNKCNQEDSSYIDGSLKIIEKENGYFKMTMKELTIKESNGDETYAKSLTLEGNDNEYWSQMDGDMKISSKCFTGNFDIKTIEKMYDMQDGSDGVRKGKIKLNGATYDFDYPNVTINAGGESKTMTQTELDKEMEAQTSCDI